MILVEMCSKFTATMRPASPAPTAMGEPRPLIDPLYSPPGENRWTVRSTPEATMIRSLESTATSCGVMPLCTMVIACAPEGSSTCTLLFPVSATTILPSESTTTPCGSLNCPAALPGSPITVELPVAGSNICTLSLALSVMMTRPALSVATPPGSPRAPPPPLGPPTGMSDAGAARIVLNACTRGPNVSPTASHPAW